MLEFAADNGADAALLQATADIATAELADHDARIPVGKYRLLVEAAKNACGDPAIALHFAERRDLSRFSVVGLITLASPTMRDAFAQINRYGRLVVDPGERRERYRLEHREDGLWLIDSLVPPDDFHELVEAAFAFMVCGVRAFSQSTFVHHVRLTRPIPADPREYARIFGAPVDFGCTENAMRMDAAWADYRVAQAPRYVFGILCDHADAQLSQLGGNDRLTGQIESLLAARLHTGDHGIATIAREMGVSRQTLYRRLRAEGTSFAALLDGLRQRLACSYLDGGKISIEEAAYLLGFSDRTAFARAFHRWSGMSPRSYRRRKQDSPRL
ncbi:AraC family transcriptional regulator [Stakelama tenebrarum]|uniref:AraC family transcriptional regulator n=1 Tax=Stakelama tenebrarum TaxID=2711215 RepID=A0A6G6Y2J0_9SPHN|nr:AraC family transcriptional regulator [Sphingosinithalassobacter tenebrarum]QIG79164.1 AraC family transcriptional regulator [Sphingosinithalassobacter tenebrarum]